MKPAAGFPSLPSPPRRRSCLSRLSSPSLQSLVSDRCEVAFSGCPPPSGAKRLPRSSRQPRAHSRREFPGAERAARMRVEGRCGQAASLAKALEQLEQRVARGPAGLPAEFAPRPLAAHQGYLESEVEPAWGRGLQAKAPADRG